MDYRLHIGQLEEAINRCRRAEPFSNGVLPTDMRLMAALYGKMIFHHLDSISIEEQPAFLQAVLAKWASPEDCGIRSKSDQSCSLRRGDAGFDGCEACQ